ncbi:low-specificity L-threonine aldolase [Metallumcola ferriviriculae]|uniref:Low-specificity L-threonine aldolase n=1 Tax=Metallumcola ferriviriculae TaxID=3039180 RepID=A0AAU0USD4_9FIRM|nr:low-specificity L-threonine aldolase [Desulfitibacteraceae bacterium MK1]
MLIDLRSDTVTKPSQEMRQAMADAVVGDDVYQEDPTVKELEQLAAGILGKESALFVPSGTMGNLVAILTHCKSGDEVFLDEESHIYFYEVGGMAALGGLIPRLISNKRGIYHPKSLEDAWRPANIHFPNPGLLCLENTHNRGGGAVVPVERMKEAVEWARKKGLPVHLDGARIFNAALALGVDASVIAEEVDSVQFCLSKGLGAPVGSILAGSEEWINRARKWRKMVGGGLRQSGVLAAAGLVALKGRNRLAEDHQRAKDMARAINDIAGLTVEIDKVLTNIFMVDIDYPGGDADDLVEQLAEAGVLVNAVTKKRLRFVTHWDIDDISAQRAVGIVAEVVGK